MTYLFFFFFSMAHGTVLYCYLFSARLINVSNKYYYTCQCNIQYRVLTCVSNLILLFAFEPRGHAGRTVGVCCGHKKVQETIHIRLAVSRCDLRTSHDDTTRQQHQHQRNTTPYHSCFRAECREWTTMWRGSGEPSPSTT